ncbi:MAG: triose-phosphate isomerase [Candidatus Diapherotrites archaeon]|nr:triose-phosphate isomerase [Candidatus Diapherotrites archaeon]
MMLLKTPTLFINFKTYKEATGQNALKLAKICQDVSIELDVCIAVVAQSVDIRLITNNLKIPVFAQHIDPIVYGHYTGHILPESVKEAGAVGTILNHAENKKSFEFIKKASLRAKEAGLLLMLCAASVNEAKKLVRLNPDFIAIELPELIGGNVSISEAEPRLITNTISTIKKINKRVKVIAGAGIKTRDDVRKALELGSDGVFVSSGIVKVKNHKEAIYELASAFKSFK